MRLRSRAAEGHFDVIHVHEPIAPVVGWDACTFDAGAPVVGTFHAYSSSWLPNTIARAIGARRVFNRLTRASPCPRRRGGRASATSAAPTT